MPLAYFFWAIYVLSLVLGVWGNYDAQPNWRQRVGGYFVLWVLVGMLGWHDFGAVIK